MTEQGGDPACWANRVCPECGRFVEDDEGHECAGSSQEDVG